ncbi:hypothetical protein HMPREF0972_01789 [Actinomyces sp. oral taxon 848 str. F0332]|nr:hypothetical protein HMPREF0972_01789 [Actinomyces sp. oral taxon 848 str. F0332]
MGPFQIDGCEVLMRFTLPTENLGSNEDRPPPLGFAEGRPTILKAQAPLWGARIPVRAARPSD